MISLHRRFTMTKEELMAMSAKELNILPPSRFTPENEEFCNCDINYSRFSRLCYDCYYCTGCTGCTSCIECISCIHCKGCLYCSNCYGIEGYKGTEDHPLEYIFFGVQLTKEEFEEQLKIIKNS